MFFRDYSEGLHLSKQFPFQDLPGLAYLLMDTVLQGDLERPRPIGPFL